MSEFIRALQRYFLGDYYPLTSYSKARDVWLAWQFDLPEDDEGMVQAFRREQSPYESARLPLRGLKPDAQYRVTDVDSSEGPQTFTGHELMTRGLRVQVSQSPEAIVLIYRQQAR